MMANRLTRILRGVVPSLAACNHVGLVKRGLLSASYTKNKAWLYFVHHKNATDDISSICLLIDRCAEKGQQYSSSTMDKMVNAIEDAKDIETSMYYLYKYRHSESGYFLRPWTMHAWVQKCVEYDAIELALKVFDDRIHYGIFPDCFAYTILLDHCLKKHKYNEAFAIASHMFICEEMDSKISQTLSLVAVHEYQKLNSKEGSVLPEFSSLVQKRNFGGICYRLGTLLRVKNLELLGMSVLGAIEKEHGIRAVYQDPWAPLVWKEGYLQDCLVALMSLETPISQETVNVFLEAVEDGDLLASAKEVVEKLREKSLTSGENLSELAERLQSDLAASEAADTVEFEAVLERWASEHREISDLENKITGEVLAERATFLKETQLRDVSRRMAVEKLGYWELLKTGDESFEHKPHLSENYVEGSSSDIEIERRRDTGELYFHQIPSQS